MAALLGHRLPEPAFAPAALMTLMPLLVARSLGLCTRQLPRLLVALNLWDLRTGCKPQAYDFTPSVSFLFRVFVHGGVSGQDLQRKQKVKPRLRHVWKTFQPRLFLHSALESNKGG